MAKPGVNINNIVCDFIMISLWFYYGFIMMLLMMFFRGQILFIMFYDFWKFIDDGLDVFCLFCVVFCIFFFFCIFVFL